MAASLCAAAAATVDTLPQPCGDTVCLWDRPRIDPPAGWALDEPASRATRVSVFVPADRPIGGAPAVFYARAARREHGDLAAFVAADLDRMLGQQLSLRAAPLPDLTGDGGTIFTVRHVAGSDDDDAHETLAYVEDGDYFVTFVLSARNKAEHDRVKAAFERWVRSYKFSVRL